MPDTPIADRIVQAAEEAARTGGMNYRQEPGTSTQRRVARSEARAAAVAVLRIVADEGEHDWLDAPSLRELADEIEQQGGGDE